MKRPDPQRTGFALALAFAVLMLVLPAPGTDRPDAGPPAAADFIAPEQLAAWVVEGSPAYVLVDVRPAAAFARDAIETALSIPADSLDAATLRSLPAHRRLVFYCGTGLVSAQVWQAVRARREGVYVLEGGLQGWRDRILEPPAPAPDAPPAAWDDYRTRRAVASYFSGEAGAAPVEQPKVVQPVLRPRGPMKASEGC